MVRDRAHEQPSPRTPPGCSQPTGMASAVNNPLRTPTRSSATFDSATCIGTATGAETEAKAETDKDC